MALDDFGAGFGSFYYLKYIPFDFVKIDGEFIRQLPSSPTDQLILDSIVQMSKGLGKRTIAEFAGDQATVEILRDRGVDYAQGFHVGPPLPVSRPTHSIRCDPASSGSTISTAPKPSSGASTKKISIVMSGSTWAWDRNATTLRPVSCSIVSVKLALHHVLEVVAHVDHAVGLAAVHDRLLQRREAAAAHHDDDDVVERVGLGLHRPATVMLAKDRDDAGRNCRQQLPAAELGSALMLPWCTVSVSRLACEAAPVRRLRCPTRSWGFPVNPLRALSSCPA